MPLVSLTRATFRSAELGFLGVDVKTRTQTPRFWGDLCRAGLLVRPRCSSLPRLTSCWIVGKEKPPKSLKDLQLRWELSRRGWLDFSLGEKTRRCYQTTPDLSRAYTAPLSPRADRNRSSAAGGSAAATSSGISGSSSSTGGSSGAMVMRR